MSTDEIVLLSASALAVLAWAIWLIRADIAWGKAYDAETDRIMAWLANEPGKPNQSSDGPGS